MPLLTQGSGAETQEVEGPGGELQAVHRGRMQGVSERKEKWTK